MKRTGRIGLVLIVVAVVPWSVWTLWSTSRTWCPIEMPIALAEGGHTNTKEFKINLTGQYEVEVEANTTNSIPPETLSCALGIGPMWPDRKCSTPPILKMRWAVTANNARIAQGESGDSNGGGTTSNSAMRTLGYFHGQSGHTYMVEVTNLGDASSLSSTNPRLRVSNADTFYEFTLVISGLLRLVSAVLGCTGLALLIISTKRKAPVLEANSNNQRL